jgi:hypothetical protein
VESPMVGITRSSSSIQQSLLVLLQQLRLLHM